MNNKRLIIGSLVGAVTLYIAGYLIFDLGVGEFYAANAGSATGVMRESQVIWAICLGTLSYAVLLTLAIESRSGSTSPVDGMKVGAVIGFLLWCTTDFILYGNQNVNNLTVASVDPLLELVRGGIGGAVIALVREKIPD